MVEQAGRLLDHTRSAIASVLIVDDYSASETKTVLTVTGGPLLVMSFWPVAPSAELNAFSVEFEVRRSSC